MSEDEDIDIIANKEEDEEQIPDSLENSIDKEEKIKNLPYDPMDDF